MVIARRKLDVPAVRRLAKPYSESGAVAATQVTLQWGVMV